MVCDLEVWDKYDGRILCRNNMLGFLGVLEQPEKKRSQYTDKSNHIKQNDKWM